MLSPYIGYTGTEDERGILRIIETLDCRFVLQQERHFMQQRGETSTRDGLRCSP